MIPNLYLVLGAIAGAWYVLFPPRLSRSQVTIGGAAVLLGALVWGLLGPGGVSNFAANVGIAIACFVAALIAGVTLTYVCRFYF